MNNFYRKFVNKGKSLAKSKDLRWDLSFDLEGRVPKSERWDLADICGLATPPYFWLSTLGNDAKALKIFNFLCGVGGESSISPGPMSDHWRDFYQAALLNELLIKRNKPNHALVNIGRSLRIIATCAGSEAPWELTPKTVQSAYNVALLLGSSGKVAANIIMVIRTLIDSLHISNRSPLEKFCTAYEGQEDSAINVSELKQGNNNYRNTSKVRFELSERKGSAKLPEEKAFWELVRIVFTEKPNTFVDSIRFLQIKLAIISGFRVGENVLLPVDWCRWVEHLTGDREVLAEKGGIARSLYIRHFAEKQAVDVNVMGVTLFESIQNVPLIFEDIVLETLSEAERLTKPLREKLRLQVATGRLLPELLPDALAPAWDIYSRLTGALSISNSSLPQNLVSKYKETFDPSYLDKIREHQIREISISGVSKNCAKYFNRLPVTIRRESGEPFTGNIDWKNAFIHVSDAESLIRSSMPTKLPETKSFLINEGGRLSPEALMFLMPIRAIVEERSGGILDVNRYFSVGRASTADLHLQLGAQANNIFSRYGHSDEDRSLRLNTHSLRHLQNAELFRLGVADTIITKRFNRRSVAQSYIYDHRSLAEDLAHIDLPKGADSMAPRAQETLQMIMAKRIRGPIVDEFLKIQEEMGDDEAFKYLSAEADGLHATPFGFCVNSFTIDPCPKHLECYDCRHLTRSGIPEEQQRLEKLKQRMVDVVNVIEAKPIAHRNIGWQNQLKHAQSRLESLEKIIETAPLEHPFPDGKDLYSAVENKYGTSVIDAPKTRRPE